MLLRQGGGPAADLFGADILDMGRDMPDMSERVFERTEPVAVELVLDWTGQFGPAGDSARGRRIDIREVDVDADRRTANRTRPPRAYLRMLVGQHYDAVADREFGMPDLAVRAAEPHPLHGAEHGLV